MRPVSIDNCFGHFFPGTSGKGVLLCGTFGLEELRHRTSLFALAQELSSQGLSVLCFDYRGTGDSTGSSLDPDILESWLGNVGAAFDWMRTDAGVTRVSLAGLRLGAIFAAMTAASRSQVEELVLLAPPASGKSFVAELLRANEGLQAQQPLELPFDGVNIAGYRLCSATLEELKKFHWRGLKGCNAASVRILSDARTDDFVTIQNVFETWVDKVEAQKFEGFVRGTADSHAARRPQSLWTQAVEQFSVPKADDIANTRALDAFKPMSGPGYLETPVHAGPEHAFAGILCQPNGGYETRKVVVFIDSPHNVNINWPRLPVDVSRRLARQGVSSLRLKPGPANDAPDFTAPDNFRDVVECLKARSFSDICIVGGTGRADPAPALAASEPRIDQLLLVDWPEPVAPASVRTGAHRPAGCREVGADARLTATRRIAMNSLAMAERNVSDSVATLQAMSSRTSASSDDEHALAARLAPYLQSGRPAQLVHLTGAAMSQDCASIAAMQKLRAGNHGLACVELDTPASLLASDRERDAFGNILIAMLGSAQTATDKPAASHQQVRLTAV